MIEAVFFDIDGTLLTGQAKPLHSTLRAIEKLHQEGILCVIASGRGPKSARSLIRGIPMDAFVLYNGQLVFTQDEGVFEHYFDADTLHDLAKFADENKREIVFGGRKEFYGSRSIRLGQKKVMKKMYAYLPKVNSNEKMDHMLEDLIPNKVRTHYYQSLPIYDKRIYQAVLLSPEAEQKELEERFMNCTITRSNPFSVDIVPKGGSKINGIRALAKHLNLDLNNCIAFGDNWNDVEMLTGVKYGIAMGNAPEGVQKLAYDVTSSNEEDGIYRALQKLEVIH
ncbi:HAD family hydrolase [Vagococcus silagei]|uniref:HAD family hydrolase n=1 Tax=Vagococcus silagei TaxID=2508885 RepID=A0A4S3B8V4_9ENTE|nr:HAD family hydrolase [Vagococcus silagei]THB61395.1 HAD family hydrolase [Vagococcus silagei]